MWFKPAGSRDGSKKKAVKFSAVQLMQGAWRLQTDMLHDLVIETPKKRKAKFVYYGLGKYLQNLCLRFFQGLTPK